MFDQDTFEMCGVIPIKLSDSLTRERTEILGIQKSKDENWLAVTSGKNLIMNEQKHIQLIIFKRIEATNPLEYDKFKISKRVVLKDIPEFRGVGVKFHFKNAEKGVDPDTIMCVNMECIFELNFVTKKVVIRHTFEEPFDT